VACPPDPIVEPAQLTRFNVPSDFVAQFRKRPFQVQIAVGGVLGAMAFAWRFVGDEAWSATEYSSGGASWAVTVDDVCADLTFAAATYVADTVYTIDANGTVSGGAGLTASLFDKLAKTCGSVTTEILMRVQDAATQPLQSWGDDWRQQAANMVYAALKRGKGASPKGLGAGDDHIFLAEDAARRFFDKIGENGLPASVVDSSADTDGPMMRYPTSDEPRGF
jgi:hypothetical protein